MSKLIIRAITNKGGHVDLEQDQMDAILTFTLIFRCAEATENLPKLSWIPEPWRLELFPEFLKPDGAIMAFHMVTSDQDPEEILNMIYFTTDNESRRVFIINDENIISASKAFIDFDEEVMKLDRRTSSNFIQDEMSGDFHMGFFEDTQKTFGDFAQGFVKEGPIVENKIKIDDAFGEHELTIFKPKDPTISTDEASKVFAVSKKIKDLPAVTDGVDMDPDMFFLENDLPEHGEEHDDPDKYLPVLRVAKQRVPEDPLDMDPDEKFILLGPGDEKLILGAGVPSIDLAPKSIPTPAVSSLSGEALSHCISENDSNLEPSTDVLRSLDDHRMAAHEMMHKIVKGKLLDTDMYSAPPIDTILPYRIYVNGISSDLVVDNIDFMKDINDYMINHTYNAPAFAFGDITNVFEMNQDLYNLIVTFISKRNFKIGAHPADEPLEDGNDAWYSIFWNHAKDETIYVSPLGT